LVTTSTYTVRAAADAVAVADAHGVMQANACVQQQHVGYDVINDVINHVQSVHFARGMLISMSA
jgi:hypothetical protein